MRFWCKTSRTGLGAMAIGFLSLSAAAAQDQGRLDSIEAIDQAFEKRHEQVEADRLEALAKLAASQQGDEAEATYRHLFSVAIIDGRVEPAEPAAQTYLKSGGQADTRALAAFVDVMAAASRGEYDAAVADLKQFLGRGESKVEPQTLYGLGETFLLRLNREGETEQAQAVANLFATGPFDKDVQEHFATKLERLKLVGQAAPPLDAKDIDGQPIAPADLKGKVVLVEFWATWCPPCLAAIPELNSLYDRYADQGLEIVGVSTDALREGSSADEVRSMLRQVAVDAYIPWRIVADSPGGDNLASAYHVSEIPASYLIDQSGKVVRIDLRGPELDSAVAKLLGVEPKAEAVESDTAQPIKQPN